MIGERTSGEMPATSSGQRHVTVSQPPSFWPEAVPPSFWLWPGKPELLPISSFRSVSIPPISTNYVDCPGSRLIISLSFPSFFRILLIYSFFHSQKWVFRMSLPPSWAACFCRMRHLVAALTNMIPGCGASLPRPMLSSLRWTKTTQPQRDRRFAVQTRPVAPRRTLPPARAG